MAEAKAAFNENAFLKNLDKKKAAAKAATKTERPSGGILSDEAVLQRLGLTEDGAEVTVTGRVTKISMGYAKKDTARPFLSFGFSLTEDSPLTGKGKGTQVSNYHELNEGVNSEGEVYRTEEQAYERLYWDFQDLGENTEEWAKNPNKFIIDAAKSHTAAKTPVQLSINTFERNNGDLGINVSVVNVLSENGEVQSEAAEAEAEVTDTTEDEGGDYNDWVGGWVTWTTDPGTDDEDSLDLKIESYNEEDDTFTGADSSGDEYTAPCAECEWRDNQED